MNSGVNVVNNSGARAEIHSAGQDSIYGIGDASSIYFRGNDTISLSSTVKYNYLVAWGGTSRPVIYGFNGTTTLTTYNAGTFDYTLEPAKPDLKINLNDASILLKNVYNNTGVIHINDAAIAISLDEYTYNYAASDGNISISGFDETSTLNVTGNFIWERHGNDIIVGVSESGTPIMYTGDFSPNDFPRDSDFKLAKVLTYNGGKCSLDTTFDATPDDYYLQLITIPQYKNFTLSTSYAATPKFENGRGGICALAVSGTCNLNGGKLNVENKGHGLNTGNELDGNAFMRNHLPLGNGHGSIFLLAKNLKMNSSTRIGASYSGAPISNYSNYGGKRGSRDFGSQGAHVLIVADKIEGLNDAAISTGGDGAGAGYCGSDGVSGAAFICCNNTS